MAIDTFIRGNITNIGSNAKRCVQGMTRHEKARVESPTGKVDVDWDMRAKTKTEERERVHFDFASSLPGKTCKQRRRRIIGFFI
jgi:hypothetical protein